MDSFITTFTGGHFQPLEPDPDLIRIEDIAHALSLICRGNGHVTTFWSVGEHCICCAREAEARGLSERLALACLLHDAAECYLSDIPRPFKRMLKEYSAWEDRVLDLIYRKFLGSSLTGGERDQVKRIDDDMLYLDLDHLLEKQPGREPEVLRKPDYAVRPFPEVEREYLELFRRYSEGLTAGDKDSSGTGSKA